MTTGRINQVAIPFHERPPIIQLILSTTGSCAPHHPCPACVHCPLPSFRCWPHFKLLSTSSIVGCIPHPSSHKGQTRTLRHRAIPKAPSDDPKRQQSPSCSRNAQPPPPSPTVLLSSFFERTHFPVFVLRGYPFQLFAGEETPLERRGLPFKHIPPVDLPAQP